MDISRLAEFINRKPDIVRSNNLASINVLCEAYITNYDRVFGLIEAKGSENIDEYRILSIVDLDDAKFQKV